jgi:hypothetical protein
MSRTQLPHTLTPRALTSHKLNEACDTSGLGSWVNAGTSDQHRHNTAL